MDGSQHDDPVGLNEETPLLRENEQEPSSNGIVAVNGEQTVIPEEPSNKKLALVLGACWLGVFLGALDSTIIATLSAPIATSFNSLSLLSWLASAYLIANSACQPICGRLTDIFSRRSGLVVSNILFAVGNLMCGLAQTQEMMIAGRVVAGMGGGGLMTISTFVGSDLVPLRKRGLIQGMGNLCFGAGAGLGGIFGGWINDVWGWRVAFLIQVPFVLISAILVFFVVDIPSKKSERSKLSRVDFIGAFLLVLTLVLLLLGLNSGGNIVPWNHPLVLVSLPLSVVVLAAFIYFEAFYAAEPVIPVRLLLHRTVAAACLTNWFISMAVFGVIFYIPIYFQAVKGQSTSASGGVLVPYSVGASVGSLGAGFIMNKTGKYKLLGVTCVCMFILASCLLCTLNATMPVWPVFIYLFMFGTGYGAMLTVTLLATIAAVDHEHQAVITSAPYAFRSTGSTIGITIASAAYQNILKGQLWSRFGGEEGAADEIERIRNSFDELKHLPPGWKTGVLDSYMDALRGVFLAVLGLSILGLICISAMRQHVLHSNLARK